MDQAHSKRLDLKVLAHQVSCCIVILLCCSCGRRVNHGADNFKPADSSVVNIFYLIGAPNGLAGVDTDIREMNKLLSDQSLGYHWIVRENGQATKQVVLSELQRIGEELKEQSSLGLYFSGHGSKEGTYLTLDGELSFYEIKETLGQYAKGFKRLIIINDSCFSGFWVEQSKRKFAANRDALQGSLQEAEYFANPSPSEASLLVSEQINAIAEVVGASKSNKAISQELIIAAASRKNETALDFGASNGGVFTYSMRQTFNALKTNPSGATWNEFLTRTSNETFELTHHHTPIFKGMPEGVLQESILDRN